MTTSFPLPSRRSSKSNNHKPLEIFNQEEDEDHEISQHYEFVTEFDPSKTLTNNDTQPKPKPKHVIPRLENTWKPYKTMRNNVGLPTTSHSFTDDLDLRRIDSAFSYGLNLRSKENGTNDGSNDKKSDNLSDRSGLSGSIENLLLQKFNEDMKKQKFKEDMKKLPEDRGFDEFIDIPVKGFGASLLASYGWSEGKGIGKNAKEDVKVVQYVGRTGREGLGFVPETNGTKREERA